MSRGSFEAYKYIEDIFLKVATQVPDSGPCVMYIGKGGSGNFGKMIHNGIEYGDMQLIAEAYDVLKFVGKLSNDELYKVFSEWNKGEFLCGKVGNYNGEEVSQMWKKGWFVVAVDFDSSCRLSYLIR
ncbi:hypothetical protein RND71_035369 [Anisodus tanguticus]|uniref:phosphogluconate dehydrogenase (NADP(+)-dependent, decarboxylating) n=1 Tax=Anisodus tanguticus TaxID=243964 RepID=A0AAE1R507_9SOLA|nr:hypothetical protein RND71_035369 [Anisodus tanguticus]